MKIIHSVSALTTICTLFASTGVHSEILWSDNSFSLLYGYEHVEPIDDSSDQRVLTFEHASGHDWGEFFMFFDRTTYRELTNDNNATYGEIAPDLSLTYLTGESLSAGPLKDVFISGNYEYGDNFDNYLYGVGASWSIPGFKYAKSMLYYANNELTDDDIQLTLVWGYQLPIDGLEVSFDGYMDWSSAEADHASELHFNPQLLLNLSPLVGLQKNKLQAGIEYSYWRNKYGLDFLDSESVVSAMVKFHF
ncbi:outer membrane protein OmpK [Gayadomonas joobiniege]|uniref:outer membrane protein OmpK n=1 Tax=Gayadomonas joobiniege TaxID=1234606 RepID=UPI00037704B0|nr:outer membrane protein OmpK [Gayadomonas joobiniege]